MVLEYVEGGDCATLLKNTGGPLPFDLARFVLPLFVVGDDNYYSKNILSIFQRRMYFKTTSQGHTLHLSEV